MRRKLLENRIHFALIISAALMIILRFLLNEKGRVTPDSIRFMRTSHVFPVIDNTTTPLGYPLSIKFFTLFGLDEFWSSKMVGILAFSFLIWFASEKKFFQREVIITASLFSFVSLFSATLSEALILPLVLVFMFIPRKIIIGQISGWRAFLILSLGLIALYNVRYPAMFFMGGVFLFGLLNFKKHFSKIFISAGLTGFAFVVLYKIFFIDTFNEDYINQALEIGLHRTSKLFPELFYGLTTAFNPFIHMANPNGGTVNIGIYTIGFLNITLATFLFIKNGLSETEKFFVFTGLIGIICSFFIQYFYSVDPLDYRLLAPFLLPVWLVYFRKLYQVFGKLIYSIPVLSLMTGLIFIMLSRGNYLQNRRAASEYLAKENLAHVPLKFYITDDKDLSNVQIAELLSTVNPNLSITKKPTDTLQKTTLTTHKVLKKIKIDTNRFQ